MKAPSFVCDTHTLIWHLQDSASLSAKARSILDDVEAGRATAIIPSIVLVEIVYLAEKNRIDPSLVEMALSCFHGDGENYQIAALDLAVAEGLRRIPRSVVPDMPDRIIAATALAMAVPLLSTDSNISTLGNIQVVW
ncbi:MAG: type II toxin-antitoxin system VapC family toxin [Thermoanaerobaculia bacterium]|nr:type II toxin-antitoxin system VapC family toxin [Thermoanaerobaculia bacterium]